MMSGNEILWRFRSILSSQFDVLRTTLDLYPRLDRGLIRQSRSLAAGFSCSPITNVLLDSDNNPPPFPWQDTLLKKADMVMQDRLTFFDLVNQHTGNPIEWHKDWSAGKTGPLRHCSFTDYRDFTANGDCKLVWEPNRHHQLVVLARAYLITNEIAYARKVAELMLDWIDSNPFGYGMNWKSPLETGIRLINWVWAIDFVRKSEIFDEESWALVLQTIYRAIWDTQRKFSEGSSANNHLIGEAAGVFIACSYFPFFPNSDEWRSQSQDILEREILAQTYVDGCTQEHAFGYQFFIVQFFALAKIAGDRSGQPFSDSFNSRLHEMYRFLAETSRDTGQPPNVGDADDGYVLDLGDLPINSTQLISVAAHLFADPKLQLAENSESAFWLFGEGQVESPVSNPEYISKAFPQSGYYWLRSESNDKRVSVFVDCAPLGYGPIAAHGHADCLSVLLSVNGKEIFVDAGTYDYFSHPNWRLYFRSTRAHNTLTVDDACQSESSGPFMWSHHATARVLDWQNSATQCRICGEHDGYQRLSDPVTHRRTVTLDKTGATLDVRDQIEAASTHQISRYLHLAPECQATAVGANRISIVRDEIEIILTTDADRTEIVIANDERKLGWISRGYHRRTRSTVIVMENRTNGSCELCFHVDILIRPS